MLELFEKSQKKIAVLQNAFEVREQTKINAIHTLSFSLPHNDQKASLCVPFNLVQWKGGPLYRIVNSELDRQSAGVMRYTCEHVIATLMDSVMFGQHVVGNLGVYTPDVIRYVLSKQTQQNWVLGACDAMRQFEYGWEQENLLAALFSIPNRFTDHYMWTYDTSVYPWRVSLKKIEESQNPQFYIRNRRNLLHISKQADLKNVCTRLYPLGAGEGINQLTIRNVNAGIPYIQSPQKYVDQYGIVERVWIDRRYENEESLKAAAQVMLNELQEPYVEYQVDVAELQSGDMDRPKVGKIVQLTDTETGIRYQTYIVEVSRRLDTEDECTINIANRPQDIASTVADLADRQRIEMAYSQGATQMYGQSIQANSDQSNGAVLDFFIPTEMKFINHIRCKVSLSPFRAYSKATAGGGATSTTSSSGGGSSTSTRSGGGTSSTTGQSGGSYTLEETSEPSNESASRHVHNFWLVRHEHSVKISAHSHNFDIPEHVHTVSLKDHTHTIAPGIYRFGSPSAFSLYVNGTKRADFGSTNADIDLTQYLVDPSSKMISRGNWQSIEIRANDLSYTTIDMFVQGFIQSRGDMTV